MTSGDLTFDLTKKVTEVIFLIFDALSNAAYPVSLRGPGAELEGGVFKHPPPPSRAWKSRSPSGARVNGQLPALVAHSLQLCVL